MRTGIQDVHCEEDQAEIMFSDSESAEEPIGNQANFHVLLTSGTSPGTTAWSRAKAAERSVPVPFSILMNAIVSSIGRRGDSAKASPPIVLSRDRQRREFLRPRRSAAKLTAIVARAEPASPVATTSPIAKDDSPRRKR